MRIVYASRASKGSESRGPSGGPAGARFPEPVSGPPGHRTRFRIFPCVDPALRRKYRYCLHLPVAKQSNRFWGIAECVFWESWR
jgi:hypothetical protein